MTNPSKDEIKLYGTRFGALHINMLVAMKKHEKEITKDLSVLANIYDLQAVYLSTLNVPKSIASSHITILNNYSMTAAALRIIANPESDPVLLPYALQARAAAASSQGPSLQAIANFIKSNGIIYPLDEAGGYWNAFNVQK